MKGLKITIDVAMTILFILLMKVSFIGIGLHELIGIGMFFLFTTHKILNYKWIRGVCKGMTNGKSTLKAKLILLLDIVILFFVTFIIISGILISQTILTGIYASNIPLWSDLHRFSAYCSLAFISVHIGLHWQMLMYAFKKLLGLTEENPARTLVARVTLVVIVVLGVRAIINPAIYWNFIAPFRQTAITASKQTTAIYTSKKETDSLSSTANIVLPLTNSLEVEAPTLEDYLSKLICNGCGKRCPLTALQCGRGTTYKNAAVAEYGANYSDGNTPAPEVTAPSDNSQSDSPVNNTTKQPKNGVYSSQRKKRNPSLETPQNPRQDVEEIAPSLTTPNEIPNDETNENSTSPLDYIGLMGIVIAGTHYTVKIAKKMK